jgi:hypothetical protein
LAQTGFVVLKVFDVTGREVATLVSQELSAGAHSATWNAARFPSGVYYYRLQAGALTDTKTFMLTR